MKSICSDVDDPWSRFYEMISIKIASKRARFLMTEGKAAGVDTFIAFPFLSSDFSNLEKENHMIFL